MIDFHNCWKENKTYTGPKDHIFCGRFGKKRHSVSTVGKRILLTAFTDDFGKLVDEKWRAGRPFHDLRSTFISRLAENDVDIKTVRDLVGHKDIATTNRYFKKNDKLMKQAADKIGGVIDAL